MDVAEKHRLDLEESTLHCQLQPLKLQTSGLKLLARANQNMFPNTDQEGLPF